MAEGERIKGALEAVAKEYRLVKDRPSEQFIAEMKRRSQDVEHLERRTLYSPRIPELRGGFSLELEEYAPHCFVISVSEYSGVWTTSTLRVVDRVLSDLKNVTDNRARLFVRPKVEQNWPTQQHFSDPERPTYLAELCVRMGFADPRSAREVASQGPLSVQELPNKTMEPTR